MYKILISAVLLFILSGIAKSQTAPTDLPEKLDAQATQEVKVSAKFNNSFVMNWANYKEPKTYLLRLRKGQRIEIASGWRDIDQSLVDPLGIFNPDDPGLQIVSPDGKLIKPQNFRYVLKAKTSGVYKIIIAPAYRKLYEVNVEKRTLVDYTFKIYFTLIRLEMRGQINGVN
jgi:hypothetical protein